MCLPCFPWSWSKFEDPLDKLDKLPEQSVWVHDGHDWALQSIQQPSLAVMPQATQGSYVIAQQPYMIQQPIMGQQPVMVNNQPQYMPQFQTMAGMPPVGFPGGAAVNPGLPIIAGNTGHIPEVAGVGRTAGEETLHQIKFAIANGLYEPQDFKPSDDDPNRFYFVREVDGNWTQRNRFSIDHMGEIRWFVTNEGWFYAVRLPS